MLRCCMHTSSLATRRTHGIMTTPELRAQTRGFRLRRAQPSEVSGQGLCLLSVGIRMPVTLNKSTACQDRPDYAVVGLSNFPLDAAKMNRGITLVRPPPPTTDLQKTMQTLCNPAFPKITRFAWDFNLRLRLPCLYQEICFPSLNLNIAECVTTAEARA